jgi:hypothetical protein
MAFACFAADIVTPFALYTVLALAVARALNGDGGHAGLPLLLELPLAYTGMLVSIGLRQIPRLRRVPRDVRRLPLFVLQITFVMVPLRIAAFATMFHQGWTTRGDRAGLSTVRSTFLAHDPASDTVMAMQGETAS